MALEGDLRLFRLPDILQVISQQQKTGILTVQGDQDILAVSFLRGDIVAADALNQNFETGLGEVLASQGLVRPESLSRLFSLGIDVPILGGVASRAPWILAFIALATYLAICARAELATRGPE